MISHKPIGAVNHYFAIGYQLISGEQVRAARALLRWTVAELAEKAGVAPNTVVRVEAEKSVNTATLQSLQKVLEEGGVVFVPENGEGAGVRRKKSGTSDTGG